MNFNIFFAGAFGEGLQLTLSDCTAVAELTVSVGCLCPKSKFDSSPPPHTHRYFPFLTNMDEPPKVSEQKQFLFLHSDFNKIPAPNGKGQL